MVPEGQNSAASCVGSSSIIKTDDPFERLIDASISNLVRDGSYMLFKSQYSWISLHTHTSVYYLVDICSYRDLSLSLSHRVTYIKYIITNRSIHHGT